MAKTIANLIPANRSKRSGQPSREELHQRLSVPHPGEEAKEPPPIIERFEILPLDAIKPYDGNPRKSANPKYADIMASIQTHGLQGALDVTKRPGEKHYTIRAGGNTRLRVLQELYRTTQEERYHHIRCIVHPYESEATLLGLHLNESNTQGEMTFWDNAVGYMALRSSLESETGTELSLRAFEAMLNERGVACKKSRLSLYAFSATNLCGLGSAASKLSATQAKLIQPAFNALARLVRCYILSQSSESMLDWAAASLSTYASELGPNDPVEAQTLLSSLLDHVAELVSRDRHDVERLLELHNDRPESTWQQLVDRLSPSPQQRTSQVTARTGPLEPRPAAALQSTTGVANRAPRHTPRNAPTPTKPLAGVQAAAETFRNATHLGTQLKLWDQAFGFWVEPWDLKHNDPRKQPLKQIKYTFWWFGAMLSCQWVPETWRALPASAQWRQLMETADAGDETSIAYLTDLNDAKPDFCRLFPEKLIVSYLKIAECREEMPDAPDPASALFELIHAIHQHLEANPESLRPFVRDRTQFPPQTEVSS